jgi:hypothetical protein
MIALVNLHSFGNIWLNSYNNDDSGNNTFKTTFTNQDKFLQTLKEKLLAYDPNIKIGNAA